MFIDLIVLVSKLLTGRASQVLISFGWPPNWVRNKILEICLRFNEFVAMGNSIQLILVNLGE